MDNYMDVFSDYAKNMKLIRILSSPDLEDIANGDEYAQILIDNFTWIGELAEKNRKVIDEIVNPLLGKGEMLSEEMRYQLISIGEILLKDSSFYEVDIHLSQVLNDLLLNKLTIRRKEGESSYDPNSLVLAMGKKVRRDYFIISELARYENSEIEAIRESAFKNRDQLAGFLEKDVFERLDDNAKESLLQFSLLGVLNYGNLITMMPEEHCEKCISIFERAIQICKDPFYKDVFPNYDWELYEFRIYYYGSFMAFSIIPEKMAKKVYEYSKKAVEFLEKTKNKNVLAETDIEIEKNMVTMAAVRSKYITVREACDAFYDAYIRRNKNDYSIPGINANLNTPLMYFNTAKTMSLDFTEKDCDRYYELEKSVLDYLYKVPKRSDTYKWCVMLFVNFLIHFKEIPGAMTMEEFAINSFAAIHPATYVHINMVARLSKCMVSRLLTVSPELFIGFPGCSDVNDVIASRDRIVSYTYRSALVHDIGKLFIIDTISMYGRKLLDSEFLIIKNHPDIGARIAKEHLSTRNYVDVIKGHHRWYDCSKGYPEDFDTRKSPYKPIIDIVLAADCLDAATDSVGRSYNKGKTFYDFEKEVEIGAGTHYAPFLAKLFKEPKLRADIEYLLSEGRRNLYRETFRLLKSNEAS